jgi:hypothetical protein
MMAPQDAPGLDIGRARKPAITTPLEELGLHCIDAQQRVQGCEVQRVALGALMPITQRKAFAVDKGYRGPRSMTGTIGFIDYIVKEHIIPWPQPASANLVDRKIILVLATGTEPDFEGHGLMKRLKLRMEDIGRSNNAAAIVMSYPNSKSIQMNTELGYTPFLCDHYMVKYLVPK